MMAYLGDINPNNGSPEIYSTYKCKLNYIVRHPHNVPIIEEAARRMHQIGIHTLQFLKLLYLKRFEDNVRNHVNQRIVESIPLNHPLVVNIAKTICVPTNIGQGNVSNATRDLRTMLRNFYNAHYSGIFQASGEIRPTYTNLPTPIDYMATKVLTMISNNIKQHFQKYVYMYVSCHRNKRTVFQDIDNDINLTKTEKNERKTDFHNRTNAIVKDVLCTQTELVNGVHILRYRSGEDRDVLDMLRRNALPNRPFIQFDIKADLDNFPLDYLHGMLVMMKFVEQQGYKIPNLFPSHTSNIPGHFRIDTSTLIDLLYPTKADENLHPAYCQYVSERTNGVSRAEASKNGFMANHQDLIWSLFIKTEKNGLFHGYRVLDKPREPDPFVDKHKYTFHYQIETNGVAASVICVDKLLAAVKMPKSPKYNEVEPYADEIGNATRAILQTKKITAIDPNMRDTMHGKSVDQVDYNNANDNNDNEAKIEAINEGPGWRYTQDTRRKKLKIKINRKRLEREKKATLGTNGVNIVKNEAFLSRFSKKTLCFESYKQYLYHKNRLNHYTGPYYRMKKHRNRQFRAFGAKQKLDAELIKNFKETYGPPAETAVFWGDWNKNSKHRRFFEPIKGKGLRKVFRKAGYLVLLVKEFRTSKMCSKCQVEEAVCKPFRHVKNPRPHMRQKNPTIKCHGLLRCSACKRLWNRDCNAATNIWIIANAAVNGTERPLYLRWENANN